MRVVHLNTFDSQGGAARAAFRLHHSLARSGVDSLFIAQSKAGDDPTVLITEGWRRAWTHVCRKLDEVPTRTRIAPHGHFSAGLFSDPIVGKLGRLAPDVLNLHWINGGFVSTRTVGALAARVPLVWTLHDSWAFTGGCHIPGECSAYTYRCGHCPVLGSARAIDLSRWLWHWKRRAWRAAELTVVTPSRWLASCAGRSTLLGGRRIEVIPNGVDLNTFRPIPRLVAREALGLDGAAHIVLFGALGATRDENKGFADLVSALNWIEAQGIRGILLVVAGASSVPAHFGLRTAVHCMGMVRDERLMAILSAAADVVAIPSRLENLPNAAIEAHACGTPVVGYRVGGLPEVVTDGSTGAVVAPRDVKAFAQSLKWIITDPQARSLGPNCRKIAEREFGIDTQARRYEGLYEDLMAARNASSSGSALRTPTGETLDRVHP